MIVDSQDSDAVASVPPGYYWARNPAHPLWWSTAHPPVEMPRPSEWEPVLVEHVNGRGFISNLGSDQGWWGLIQIGPRIERPSELP